MSEPAPRFQPLKYAARPAQLAAALIGPVLWLGAFAILAVVARETSAIAHGIAIATGSFLVALVALIAMRRRRVREQAEGEPRPDR